MNTQEIYDEKVRIRQFKCEVKDVIDELALKTADEVDEMLKPVMPKIREAAMAAAAALKAFTESAPFGDDHLKNALYESFDEMPNIMEMFVVAGVRSAVRKAFESMRLDVDEKANMALEGLDILSGE